MASRKQTKEKPHVPPPLQALYPEPFWTYVRYDTQKQAIVDQWLDHNKKDVQILLLNPNFNENLRSLTSQLGSYLHPTLQSPNEAQLETGDQFHFFSFHKVKVDWLTLKLLTLLINQLSLQVLQFKDNNLQQEELVQINNLLTVKDSKIFKLFVQNNPLPQQMEFLQDKHHTFNPKDFFIKLGTLQNIEFLILKDNELDDDFASAFVSEIKHHQPNNLRHLDLSGNQITQHGCESLASILESPNQLVYLGLQNNGFTRHKEIKSLLHLIGRHKIHNEEVQRIQDLEQQREAQIQKFTKQKKKFTDDMLIPIPKYVQSDGNYFLIPNPLLQILNISDNNFSDTDKDAFEKFLYYQQDPFLLVLDNNLFDEQTKLRFKKKFRKNVII